MPKLTPKLKHLLKLILLGPQPKDEWHEEWIRDPLAEWFRQQSAGSSRKSKWRLLTRKLTGDWSMCVPLFGWLLGIWFLPDDLRYINILATFVILYLLTSDWKSRKRKSRPSDKLVDLFQPTAQATAVIDLWSCGFKGRDMVRLAYLQRAVGVSFVEMIALLSSAIATVLLIVALGEFSKAVVLILILVLIQSHVRGYCFHRNAYPFRIWFLPSTRLDLPGVRAIRNWDLSSADNFVSRLVVPLWPLFASPLIVYWMLQIVSDGRYSLSTAFFTYFLLVALSVVLMHVLVRGRRASDLEYLEDAFLTANRDFDHWVRTELIGDEDAKV